MDAQHQRNYTRLAAAAVVAAVVIAASISVSAYIGTARTVTHTVTITSTQTSSESSSSCYYYIPDAVPCRTGYNFTPSVNYNGPWKLTYQGYNGLGMSNFTTVSGSYGGTGIDSRSVIVGGSHNGWTLCVQAMRMDDSNSTLSLTISGATTTSLQYGSISTCQEAQLGAPPP